MSLQLFISAIKDYHILPHKVAVAYGSILPFLELISAVLLIFSKTFLLGILMVIFILLTIIYSVFKVMKTQRIVSCGCYGSFLKANVDLFTLVKLMILLLISVFLLMSKPYIDFSYSYLQILTGLFLTCLLLTCQKAWSSYQEAITIIKSKHLR
jgi:hypothetical protein